MKRLPKCFPYTSMFLPSVFSFPGGGPVAPRCLQTVGALIQPALSCCWFTLLSQQTQERPPCKGLRPNS